MSKYEDGYFANMKIGIFLIIGFTQFVFSCDLNDTLESLPVCPFNLFRRKRDVAEYTRWRANLETTPEFIVKVLDEDVNTMRPNKLVGVNIQPITKGMEKIIVGGAIVHTQTSAATTMDDLKYYTRFIPPTTTVRIEGTVYLAPIKPPTVDTQQFIAMLPRGKNPQRDESPPAGPQFITRNPLNSRQYAPITPVGFTRRSLIEPLTPPTTTSSKEPYNFRKMMRTNPFEEIKSKQTAKLDVEENGNFLPSEDDSYHSFMSTASTEYYLPLTNNYIESTASRREGEDNILKPPEKNHVLDKNDKDDTYNNMFYDDDDENKNTGHHDHIDAYLDKLKERANAKDSDSKNVSIKSDFESLLYKRLKTEENLKGEEDNIMEITINIRPTLPNLLIEMRAQNEQRVNKKLKVCNIVKLRKLHLNTLRTLPEIMGQLREWAEESPVAKWVDITYGNFTVMENPIYMMIVDDPSSGQIITAKQTVMIVAGIQGRDHHAVAAAMYILYQLIERSTVHADLLTKYRFWIIPVLNPDGYDYAMTFPHRRNWAKNLRQNWDYSCKGRGNSCRDCEAYGLRCTIQPCYGVNLDRNFEYQWIPPDELRSEHPCGPLYAGERQLSEVETRSFTRLLHDRQPTPFTFIAFKEGAILGVMYPYSHTRKRRALDDVFRQRAFRAARAASSISGRPYVAGQTSEFLPLYAGGIEDWVDGHLGIDNTYTIMMYRQADTYNHKLTTEQVIHEAYAAMDTLLLQSIDHLVKPRVALMSRRSIISGTVAVGPSVLLPTLLTIRIFFT